MSNRPLEDDRLSWKATGMMAYLLTKPDNWEINIKQLMRAKKDGRDAIKTGFRELKKAGYLKQIQIQDAESGKFTSSHYVLSEDPQSIENTMG